MQLSDALREVHVDSTIIDQDVLHLQISSFCIFVLLKFDESVIERIA